jgi:hypothetical protein
MLRKMQPNKKLETTKKIHPNDSNYLLQILKLHMILFKLQMIQANNKLFFTKKIIQINLTLLNYHKYYY